MGLFSIAMYSIGFVYASKGGTGFQPSSTLKLPRQSLTSLQVMRITVAFWASGQNCMFASLFRNNQGCFTHWPLVESLSKCFESDMHRFR